MTNQELKLLYKKAIDIENHSSSPRILNAHKKGKHCQVSLGTYFPETTRYMFVSLNPGGEYYLTRKQNAEQSALEHPTFKEYLNDKFRYAINMKKIIKSFASKNNISLEEASLLFGTTDMSFFHSRNTSELEESYFIEVKESLPILMEELSLKSLGTIIFSGITYEHFFFNLYQAGSSIENYRSKKTVQDWIISFNTKLINNRSYCCVFITHLSGTRGLKDDSLNSIGIELADLL